MKKYLKVKLSANEKSSGNDKRMVKVNFFRYNILVHSSGSDPNVLQITPPLIINRNQVNYFIKSMDELLSNGVMSIAAKFFSKNVLQR